ncbi:MAG TPA: GIY-YIG nuclease family protein [Rhodanobacter sp.]|nr:GIY-YIG nuclease family protein [Rhodanobacter sp.]
MSERVTFFPLSSLRRQESHFNARQAMDQRQPCVYMLASKKNGVLYIGVTSDLVKRIWQHKNDVVEGYTHRYGIHTLVWYELHPTVESAILREKMLKRWKRDWKMRLINEGNAEWRDLYPTIL